MRHLKSTLLTTLLLLCPLTKAQAAFEAIHIAAYDDTMGRVSLRDSVPEPLLFSDTRRAERYFELGYLREQYSFWNRHVTLALGGSYSYSSKSDASANNANFSVHAVSLLPEARINFQPGEDKMNPFMTWSIAGLSYLWGNRDNGNNEIGKWQFKNHLGVGVEMGMWQLQIKWVDFSRARILHKKQGFEIPWVISAGYALTL